MIFKTKKIVLDIELAFVLTRLKWVLWSQLNFLNCTLMLSFHSDQMSIHCDHSCQAELLKVLHKFCVLLINCIFAAHQFHSCCLISNGFFSALNF